MMWFKAKYKTKKLLIDDIRALIARQDINSPIVGDDLDFIMWVLQNHSEWECKKGAGIASIVVRNNYKFTKNRELILIRTDGSEIDISWNHCLTPKSNKDNIISSARYEIKDQKQNIQKSGICYLCGDELVGDIHIDHVITFDSLFNSFINEEKIDLDSIQISKIDGYFEEFKDRELANRWKEYHKKNAVMKPVHAKCNLSRGRS